MRARNRHALLLLIALPAAAQAKPEAPQLFCETAPATPVCQGRVPACTLCHTAPPAWNAFGTALASRTGGDFRTGLRAATSAIAQQDSDGDGVSNGQELLAGTNPGEARSVHHAQVPSGGNGTYQLGKYDPRFALRRITAAFCGESPTYDDLQALAASADPRAFLHQRLGQCLTSAFWQREALPRLADKKIRPVGAAGSCVSYYANFEFDYDLFVYALTNDRDARDLLRAQYHVARDAAGNLVKIDENKTGPIRGPVARAGVACRDRYGNSPPQLGGQPLEKPYRAGMITTQWFLWKNTMGTYLPRQTAAQAYRAYLGFDISHHEGLMPAASEPRDIDRKGVGRAPCSHCHSTLDPLAYAFAYYWGGTGSRQPGATGTYMVTRPLVVPDVPDEVKMDWLTRPPVAQLFGMPLPPETDGPAVVAWAHRAAESDAFKRHLTELFFGYAVGRAPVGPDHAELEPIWRALPADGHSVNKLLHRLIDTLALGAP